MESRPIAVWNTARWARFFGGGTQRLRKNAAYAGILRAVTVNSFVWNKSCTKVVEVARQRLPTSPQDLSAEQ